MKKPPDEPTLRPATSQDVDAMWLALARAAHIDSVDSAQAIASAKANPDLARYVEGFGRDGDVGVLAESADGDVIGVAWTRTIQAYGFVREGIPELAVSVAPGWRGRRIGQRLMRALFAALSPRYRAVSLSVRRDSPAVRLYLRLGFDYVAGSNIENRVGTESVTMLRTASP